MNYLVIGSNKQPLLQHLPRRDFLLVDDGPLIDQIAVRSRTFDVSKHTFNPLKDMDYRTAQDFAAVFEAIFPGGENTLTKQNTSIHLMDALLAKPSRLSTLIEDTKDTHDAYMKVRRLLMSPVLERVLEQDTNFAMTGTILARLDRSQLGRFDAFVLGNLLISQYPGTVAIPDFGFYAHKGHADLIEQGRLIAGINSFDEVPTLKSQLMLIEDKVASRCTPPDAEVLALYAGIPRGTNAYNDFIERCIRPA